MPNVINIEYSHETDQESQALTLGHETEDIHNLSITNEEDGIYHSLSPKVELKKETGLFSLVFIIIGAVVGSSIFMTPNIIATAVPSFLYSLIIWISCGVLTLLASLCYAELALLYPKCGGEQTYFEEAYHPCISFAFLITSFLLIKPTGTAVLLTFAVQNIFSIIYPEAMSPPNWPSRLIACLLVILLFILNSWRMRASIMLNNILTYSKFVCMALILGLGIYTLAIRKFENFKGAADPININPTAVSFAIFNGMWSYNGWNVFVYMVEEIKNPSKDIIRSILISSITLTILYALLNLSYLVVLGITGVINSSSVALDTTSIYFGKYAIIVVILVSLSSLGSGNCGYICASRIYFDGARKGIFPKLFSTIQKKTNTIYIAYFSHAIMSMLYILFSSNIPTLILYFSTGIWVFYGLTFLSIAVIRYRIRPKNQIFKVPLILPIFMTLLSIALIILSFISNAAQTSVAICIIVASILFYFVLPYMGIYSSKILRPATMNKFNAIISESFGLEYTH